MALAPSPRRQLLQDILKSIADHVYFQPPTNVKLEYPCILYARDGSNNDNANNELYRRAKRFQVTVIDREPDSILPDLVEALPMCSITRYFALDNLNHWVFTLIF